MYFKLDGIRIMTFVSEWKNGVWTKGQIVPLGKERNAWGIHKDSVLIIVLMMPLSTSGYTVHNY